MKNTLETRIGFFVALTVLAVVTAYSFMARPVYMAEGTLLIEREQNITSFNDIFQIESFNDDYFQSLAAARERLENSPRG